MVGYKLRIFVRVIKKRMADEGISAEEVLNDYPKLTESEIEKLILLTSEGNKYYVRDTNQYVPFDWVRLGCNQIKNILSWFILPNIEKYFDIENMNDIMSNEQSVFGKA